MSIAANLIKVAIHQVDVELEVLNEKDQFIKVPVTVFYKSRSTKETRAEEQRRKEKEAVGDTLFLADLFLTRLTKIVEKDGTVIDITEELLDGMDVRNLKRIERAILDNSDPK